MSDEMVQEKTNVGEVGAEASRNGGHPGESDAFASSPPDAPFVAPTEEPAPAQTVAEMTAPATPTPPAAEMETPAAQPTPEASAPVTAEASAPATVNAETSAPSTAAATHAAPVAVKAEATAASSSAPTIDEFAQAMKDMAEVDAQYDRKPLQEGDVVTGIVMHVDREGILVDVGAKSEGIVRLNEISREPGVNPEDIVKAGDKISVFVLEPENQDGNPILSKKRADFEQAWVRVQQAKNSGETLMAIVQERVKGGLVVDLGIRGFVPASHVGNGSLKNNLDRYLGQSIPLKVIEVDKERRKVVLSNKMAEMEQRDARSRETKENLAPGQIRRGVVRRLTAYGAFIDLGGIDGLLHISEMSWTRINDPKEVMREGQEVDVIVLKIDIESNRVSLGMRQILPDPWAEIGARYKEGDVITGSVSRVVPFGAFVHVEGGVEGIIPNVELPRNRAIKGGAPIAVGEEVEVKVLSVRPEERKMTLSMRALQPAEEQQAPREAGPPREPREPREGAAPAAGGAPKRGRSERNREDEGGGDYGRFAAGRQEEPRFNALGDAFTKARVNRRERRENQEQEVENFDDIEIEGSLAEDTAAEEPTTETTEGE